MSDEIRVNGNQHSWGSITIKVAESRFTGFTSISFGDSRERVKAYGMGRHQAPRGRSRGKYVPDPVAITGWKASVQTLRDQLALFAADGRSYGDVQFEVVVQYFEFGTDRPVTVEIRECVWSKNATSDEEGPDPLKEDFELDCMRILRNGKTLYDSIEGV